MTPWGSFLTSLSGPCRIHKQHGHRQISATGEFVFTHYGTFCILLIRDAIIPGLRAEKLRFPAQFYELVAHGRAAFRLAAFVAAYRADGLRASNLRASGLWASGLRASDLWASG